MIKKTHILNCKSDVDVDVGRYITAGKPWIRIMYITRNFSILATYTWSAAASIGKYGRRCWPWTWSCCETCIMRHRWNNNPTPSLVQSEQRDAKVCRYQPIRIDISGGVSLWVYQSASVANSVYNIAILGGCHHRGARGVRKHLILIQTKIRRVISYFSIKRTFFGK